MTRLAMAALMVVGAGVGAGGCGGKAQGDAAQESPGATDDTVTPGGSYQPPSGGGYQAPPPTYDNPPPTYQTPGGATAAVCTELCNIVASGSCQAVATAADIAACPGACEDAFAQYDICAEEFAAALRCFLHSPTYQDFLSQLCAGNVEPDLNTDELLAQCETELTAYAACSGDLEQNPGNQCNENTGACSGCDSNCSYCECTYGTNAEECTALCDAGP